MVKIRQSFQTPYCIMLKKTLAPLKCTSKEVSFELSHRRFRSQTQKFEPPYSRLHLTEVCKSKIPFNGQYTFAILNTNALFGSDACLMFLKDLYGAFEDKMILYCLGYCFHEVSFFIDQCVVFALFQTAFLFPRWILSNWIEDMDLISLIQD